MGCRTTGPEPFFASRSVASATAQCTCTGPGQWQCCRGGGGRQGSRGSVCVWSSTYRPHSATLAGRRAGGVQRHSATSDCYWCEWTTNYSCLRRDTDSTHSHSHTHTHTAVDKWWRALIAAAALLLLLLLSLACCVVVVVAIYWRVQATAALSCVSSPCGATTPACCCCSYWWC